MIDFNSRLTSLFEAPRVAPEDCGGLLAWWVYEGWDRQLARIRYLNVLRDSITPSWVW